MKLKQLINLITSQGLRWTIFRIKYALETKSGLLKNRFPINPKIETFISLEDWRKNAPKFFFESKEDLMKSSSLRHPLGMGESEDSLGRKVFNIRQGIFTFFSSTEFNLGKDYDWVTNPDTGFKYDINKHWTEIADLSKEAGDIKYVWEKARFSWLHTLIRYDLQSGEDQSEFVFSEIEDFIDKNPINQGPNYKCSQEISLRTLNWIFALYYYRNSNTLNETLFQKLINNIYWNIHHVYNNIDFSRIAVRNNHAITETMMLYLSNLLFPFIPETQKWSRVGKRYLEEELEFQVFEDGSFLQYSHNYHRVMVQLFTWMIKLSELNNDKLSDIVYTKATKTLEFLLNQQDSITGQLPNYGMNDGALFFPLNSNNYRDFRPQLQALANVLGIEIYKENFEDSWWYTKGNSLKDNSDSTDSNITSIKQNEIIKYDVGGFYGFREKETLTTLRCGNYKTRPAQADALNIDIWYNGVNVIFDPGTYKYNTESKYINFYHGTSGHNTISIGNHSQMLKGGRFLWYYWTKAFDVKVKQTEHTFEFEGKIEGFVELGKNIIHCRKVIKYKSINKWKVIDTIKGYEGELPMVQHWNLNECIQIENKEQEIRIQALGKDRQVLKKEYQQGWYSEKYGIKEDFDQLVFKTNDRFIETIIEIV